MSVKERLTRLIEGLEFYTRNGVIPAEFTYQVIGALRLARGISTEEELNNILNKTYEEIRQFFELYSRKDISWKEKSELYLKMFGKSIMLADEQAYNQFVMMLKNYFNNEEMLAKIFEVLKELMLTIFKALHFTSTCKCGEKVCYDVVTYNPDGIPEKVEFFCEKCGQEIVEYYKSITGKGDIN
jgi:hypothetical protein